MATGQLRRRSPPPSPALSVAEQTRRLSLVGPPDSAGPTLAHPETKAVETRDGHHVSLWASGRLRSRRPGPSAEERSLAGLHPSPHQAALQRSSATDLMGCVCFFLKLQHLFLITLSKTLS